MSMQQIPYAKGLFTASLVLFLLFLVLGIGICLGGGLILLFQDNWAGIFISSIGTPICGALLLLPSAITSHVFLHHNSTLKGARVVFAEGFVYFGYVVGIASLIVSIFWLFV